MQRKSVRIWRTIIAVCLFWVCGITVSQSNVLAQTKQDTKPRHSEADGISPLPAQPGEFVDKSPAMKRPRKFPADVIMPGPTGTANREAQDTAWGPSSFEINSAKSLGKVWVNPDSKTYYKSGRWFGATRKGRFMTERDAIKGGYKPAVNEK